MLTTIDSVVRYCELFLRSANHEEVSLLLRLARSLERQRLHHSPVVRAAEQEVPVELFQSSPSTFVQLAGHEIEIPDGLLCPQTDPASCLLHLNLTAALAETLTRYQQSLQQSAQTEDDLDNPLPSHQTESASSTSESPEVRTPLRLVSPLSLTSSLRLRSFQLDLRVHLKGVLVENHSPQKLQESSPSTGEIVSPSPSLTEDQSLRYHLARHPVPHPPQTTD